MFFFPKVELDFYWYMSSFPPLLKCTFVEIEQPRRLFPVIRRWTISSRFFHEPLELFDGEFKSKVGCCRRNVTPPLSSPSVGSLVIFQGSTISRRESFKANPSRLIKSFFEPGKIHNQPECQFYASQITIPTYQTNPEHEIQSVRIKSDVRMCSIGMSTASYPTEMTKSKTSPCIKSIETRG